MKLDNTVIKQKTKPDLKSEIFFGIKIIAVASLFFVLNSTDLEAKDHTKKHYGYRTKKERRKAYPFAPIPGKYKPNPGLFDFDITGQKNNSHTGRGGDHKGDTISAPTPSSPPSDRDGDGIVDSKDDCPDLKGLPKFHGCPDTDGDDVVDSKDLCPDTQKGIKVDKNGCPVDTDKDGLADYIDECPKKPGPIENKGCPRPPSAPSDRDGDGIIDSKDDCPDIPGLPKYNGCPDTDGDGVIDSEDQCPKSPGTKKNQGCPKNIQVIDTDGDGILDYEDECPDTPTGVEVDEVGCPKDRDEDGISNYLDDCPDDPGFPQFNGCPDRDGDEIMDKIDDCPELPGLPKYNGCPDSDGDGVIDPKDLCPDTQTVIVDQYGCPLDTDGDGLSDEVDQCPNEYGPMEYLGCPVPPEPTRPDINQETLPKTSFETDKYELTSDMKNKLDEVIIYLLNNPMMDIRISVFTDPRGTKEHNQVLTEKRTEQIEKYFVYKGISAERIHIHNSGFQGVGNNYKDKINLSRRVIIEPFFVFR